MKHHWTGKLCTGWTNLDKESRLEVLAISEKIVGAINASEAEEPEAADGLFEFHLAMLGMEIVGGGLGFSPPIGTIRCPSALAEGSWNSPAYIVPMNL